MKGWLRNYFIEGGFRREFKKELKMLILFTLGFTIAFTWRQTFFDISLELMGWLTNITDKTALSILTSAFITFLSLGIIYFLSHFLKEEY